LAAPSVPEQRQAGHAQQAGLLSLCCGQFLLDTEHIHVHGLPLGLQPKHSGLLSPERLHPLCRRQAVGLGDLQAAPVAGHILPQPQVQAVEIGFRLAQLGHRLA